MSGSTALVARLDSAGDVLISGPAVRAVAAAHDRVVFLAGPRGRSAGELLPGVDEVLEWQAPWVDFDSPPRTSDHVVSLVKQIVDLGAERALIFTSCHQSPLPLALLLRMAEIPWVAAISDDYPGRLLDLRHRVDARLPEPLRALSLAQAAAYRLPVGDDGRLHVNPQPLPDNLFRRIGSPKWPPSCTAGATPWQSPDRSLKYRSPARWPGWRVCRTPPCWQDNSTSSTSPPWWPTAACWGAVIPESGTSLPPPAPPSVLVFGPTPPARWGPRGSGPHVSLWAGDVGDPHADRPHPGLLLISPARVLAAIGELLAVPA